MSLRIALIVTVTAALGVSLTGCSERPYPAWCVRRTGSSTPVGTYEWRADEWRDSKRYAATLDLLRAACVSDLSVDVTGAAELVVPVPKITAGASGDATADPPLVAFDGDLERLIAAAGERSIRIHALAGDPGWTDDHAAAQNIVRYIEHFNNGRTARIESLQFDVEPWGETRWASERDHLLVKYLEMVRVLTTNAKDGLRLGFAIPYWFDGTAQAVAAITFDGLEAFPLTHLMKIVNDAGSFVAVMAYRNQAFGERGSIGLVPEELREASGAGVFVVQETAKIDEKSASFFGEDARVFSTQMRKLSKELERQPQFAGLLLHDVPSLLALLKPRSDAP